MGLIDLVFPKTCLECHKEGAYICKDCLSKVKLGKPVCPVCEKASIDGLTHTKCAKKFGLDGLTSIWEYEGIIRKAILALKYKYALEVGRELCGKFAEYLHNSSLIIPNSNVLVPIPIFWHRQNVRGFNQSIEVGKEIASVFGWKFEPNLLVRTKSTKPQTELSGDERRVNLKGAFSLNPDCVLGTVHSVLIFDDVFTTGSTLMEAAKVLKKGGVEKVWGLTIAR